MAFTTSGSSSLYGMTPMQQQQLFQNHRYGYTMTGSAPVPYVKCAECDVAFKGGLGGEDAQSYDEAVVAAYAHGWYVGKNLKICLDCRKKIKPDNVDESLLQTDNATNATVGTIQPV